MEAALQACDARLGRIASAEPPAAALDREGGLSQQPPQQLAERLRNEAAKGLEAACLNLCTSLHATGLSECTSSSLKEDCQVFVQSVVQRVQQLVQSIKAPAQVGQSVGLLWEVLESVRSSPLTNKSAVFKRLAKAIESIRDAMREMAEFEQQPMGSIAEGCSSSDADEEGGVGSAGRAEQLGQRPDNQTNGHANGQPGRNGALGEGGEDDDGMSDGGCDYEVGLRSAHDNEVAACGRALMAVVLDMLKAVSRLLLQGPDRMDVALLEAWENSVWHSKNLQRSVEDLGAAMYPPQDLEEVQELLEAVVVSTQCMLDEVPCEGQSEAGVEAVAQIHSRLEGAESRLQAAVLASKTANG